MNSKNDNKHQLQSKNLGLRDVSNEKSKTVCGCYGAWQRPSYHRCMGVRIPVLTRYMN